MVEIPLTANGDTSPYYFSKQGIIKAINLTDLKESGNIIAMRIWTEKEIIELNYNDSNNITGAHTFFAAPNPGDNKKPYVFKKSNLNAAQLKQITHLTDSFNIRRLPSEDQIECWGIINGSPAKRDCNDGITYIIEFSNPETYSFKTYDCPWTWSCKEAATFNSFIMEIEKLLDSNQQFQKFINDLPGGCYSTGRAFVICNNLPRKGKKDNR